MKLVLTSHTIQLVKITPSLQTSFVKIIISPETNRLRILKTLGVYFLYKKEMSLKFLVPVDKNSLFLTWIFVMHWDPPGRVLVSQEEWIEWLRNFWL